MLAYFYKLGALDAAATLGLDTAEEFASAVAEVAPTPQDAPQSPEASSSDKPVHWGPGASLDAGDAGTRQNQLGIPASSGAA